MFRMTDPLPAKVFALLALAACVACGRPFDAKTPPGFVELEGQSGDETPYAYRATTPEGVVVAVRVVDDEARGDLGFWTQTVTRQLREVSGYALVGTSDVTARDGTAGRRLVFGHDEGGKPYTYWVTLWLAQGRVFVAEAGGESLAFERAKPSVEYAMASVRVRCESAVAPVLASRTCNRW